MPQHWRTSRVYVIVVFAILTLFDVMTSFCDVTWRHDVILWHHTKSWHDIIIYLSTYLTQHPTAIMLWHHNMTSRDVMTSDDVMWCHITSLEPCDVVWCHIMSWCHWLVMMPHKTVDRILFLSSDLDLWPMTLIIKLILDIDQLDAHTKFRVSISNGSAVRAQTNRRTDKKTGPILLPRPPTREVMSALTIWKL